MFVAVIAVLALGWLALWGADRLFDGLHPIPAQGMLGWMAGLGALVAVVAIVGLLVWAMVRFPKGSGGFPPEERDIPSVIPLGLSAALMLGAGLWVSALLLTRSRAKDRSA